MSLNVNGINDPEKVTFQKNGTQNEMCSWVPFFYTRFFFKAYQKYTWQRVGCLSLICKHRP